MSVWPRLERWASAGGEARVAVVGAGFVGRGLIHRLERTPGMAPALVVNRTPETAIRCFELAGRDRTSIVLSDDPAVIEEAVTDNRPVVTSVAEVLEELRCIEVVVEATGAMDYGARVILGALRSGKDVVSMNAELDATIGYLLHEEARRAGAVYTIADGDQPGVLLRQISFVAGMGFEIVAAVNCKRNLDIHQNPTDSAPYAARDGTSPLMTTAFGDGTKLQIENAVVANATGLIPERRGMHGIATTLEHAVRDVVSALSSSGVVEYTLGGDFGGGVLVIGRSNDPTVAPYMRYSKLGEGPDYLFFRPYHLLHFEVPLTIADVVLDRQSLSLPAGSPHAEVVTVAKRPLEPGERLDGIGGYACYGHVDTVERARGFLPIGLAEHAQVVRAVAQDEPVALDAVELDADAELVRLRAIQDDMVRSNHRATA